MLALVGGRAAGGPARLPGRDHWKRDKADWSRYPLTAGTPDFRAAVPTWLNVRYRLPAGLIDRDRGDHALCRQHARRCSMLALAAVPEWQGKDPRPAW